MKNERDFINNIGDMEYEVEADVTETVVEEAPYEEETKEEKSYQEKAAEKFFTSKERVYDGERVDITSKESILNYGQEYIDRIAALSESFEISDDADPYKNNAQLTIDEIVVRLEGFKHIDQEINRHNDKVTKFIENKDAGFIGKIKNYLMEKRDSELTESYSDIFHKKQEEIEELDAHVLGVMEQLNEEYTRNLDYVTELNDILGDFNACIEAGYNDLNFYGNKIKEYEAQGPQNGEDEFTFKINIKQAQANVTAFDTRLRSLRTKIELDKDRCIKKVLGQLGDDTLLQVLQDIRSIGINDIKSQMHQTVELSIQSNRIAGAKALTKGLNDVIIHNSKQVNKNIEDVQKLALDGTIYTSTIKQISEDTSKSIKSLQDFSKKMLKANQEKDKAIALAEANHKEQIKELAKYAIENVNGTVGNMLQAAQTDAPKQLSEMNKERAKALKLGAHPATKK